MHPSKDGENNVKSLDRLKKVFFGQGNGSVARGQCVYNVFEIWNDSEKKGLDFKQVSSLMTSTNLIV